MRKRTPIAIGLAAGLTIAAVAQSQLPPRFEVATIKPLDPHGQHLNGIEVYPGGRLKINGFSVKALICTAYQATYWQLSGGEKWMEQDLFDITALPPQAAQAAPPWNLAHTLFEVEDERLRAMLQSLLAERFALHVHFTKEQGKVFLLERAGGTLHASVRTKTVSASETNPGGGIGFADRWVISNMSMPELARFASSFVVHRPVLDRTGLAEFYDYKSEPEGWEAYQANPEASFMALLKAMGLRLKPSTGDVTKIVIDHAEHPTPD